MIISLMLMVQLTMHSASKMNVIWLNNGGGTLTHEDWITLKISTPNLSRDIVCANGYGYTY